MNAFTLENKKMKIHVPAQKHGFNPKIDLVYYGFCNCYSFQDLKSLKTSTGDHKLSNLVNSLNVSSANTDIIEHINLSYKTNV